LLLLCCFFLRNRCLETAHRHGNENDYNPESFLRARQNVFRMVSNPEYSDSVDGYSVFQR